MAKEKDIKTNAMRILDRNKIPYEVNTYECDEYIDGIHIAIQNGQDPDISYKTLVMIGKSKNYYVFVLPIAEEVDMKKAAKSVGEKSVEMMLNRKIGYLEIADIIEYCISKHNTIENPTIEQILEIENWVNELIESKW